MNKRQQQNHNLIGQTKQKPTNTHRVTMKQFSEQPTQSRFVQRIQSQRQQKFQEDNKILNRPASYLANMVVQQNQKELLEAAQKQLSIMQQLFNNNQLRNKKNIVLDQRQENTEDWISRYKFFQQSQPHHTTISTNIGSRIYNFNNYLSNPQNSQHLRSQKNDLNTTKTSSKSNLTRISSQIIPPCTFYYKITVVKLDMVDKIPIILSYHFQTNEDTDQFALTQKTLSSIENRFTQYNKQYFIKSLKLKPQIIKSNTNTANISGNLQIKLLDLPKGYFHQPSKFQFYQIQELKIYNKYGSIMWKNIDLRDIDAARNVRLQNCMIECKNQKLNRQCTVTFKAFPFVLEKYKKSINLFNLNIQEIVKQAGEDCQLLEYSLSDNTWQLFIKKFP